MQHWIIIFLILLTACTEKAKDAADNLSEKTKPEFQLSDSTYVILEFKSDWYWIFKAVEPTNLSRSELAEVEEIIQVAVKENNEQQRKNLKEHNGNHSDNKWTETGFELELEGFKRQYVPVINKDGQKEIWINFFCDDWESGNWKSEIMMVNDGGNCYFNLKVNLETKTYSELRINGYA